ncbi:MAG: glutamate 5-kinase [Alphaproteobacteria bacterium]
MKLKIENFQRIVVKIGSSLLIQNEQIRQKWLTEFAKDVKELIEKKVELIIVTSGAVALGRSILANKSLNKLSVEQKQACASVGQIKLMSTYHEIFKKFDLTVAQILLTATDCNSRKSYLNCQNTINTLIKNNAIAIINENDSVAVDEIKIGDNDRLASRVAQMTNSDLLILFSDIDGLFDKNPKTHKNAQFISQINKIDKNVENMAKGSSSLVGTGGMITKIQAAKMALNANCPTVITSGIENRALQKLFFSEKKYTIFCKNDSKNTSSNQSIKSKKNWLYGIVNPKGILIVNDLASQTLQQKKASLLAVGVIALQGNFMKGDVVFIKDQKNQHIASGIVNYSKNDAEKILQKNSEQIKKIFGNKAKPELVHIDNLVIVI